MKSQKKPRRKSGSGTGSTETHDSKLLASKLFSYLICHGEDCRLPIGSVAERLQKFSGDKSYDSKKALAFVNSSRGKFVVKNVEGKNFVEAKTSVKICDAFQEGKCKSGGCKGLHICRFFLEDECKFGVKCKKPHGFDSPQTKDLLAHRKLDSLSTNALTTLFRKVLNEKKIKHASSSSGPSACKFYNKGDCKNGDKCEFLHVCEYYIDGDCKFGDQLCKRSHNFDSTHAREVLADHSLGKLRSESQILSVLQSNRAPNLDSDSSDSDDSANEKMEICSFNLRGKCNYGNKCKFLHTVPDAAMVKDSSNCRRPNETSSEASSSEITDFDDEVCERHVPWLARHLSKDVEKVAILLEVDAVEIEAIKQGEPQPEKRNIKTLNSWRNAEMKLGKKPTWEKVCSCLEDETVGRFDVIRALLKEDELDSRVLVWLAPHIAASFKKYARVLGVPECEIDMSSQNFEGVEGRCMDVLERWRRRTRYPKVEDLIQALEEDIISRPDLAEKMREKFCNHEVKDEVLSQLGNLSISASQS